LGVDADYPYEQCVHTILPGECLVLFTDGISEAMNAANELYGLARLRQQVGAPDVGVPQLGRRILENVRQFVGGQPQSDDMCLTCFGRNP
jgi:sigma-B regulation protein RsbU (phosphoserine phosphatase)